MIDLMIAVAGCVFTLVGGVVLFWVASVKVDEWNVIIKEKDYLRIAEARLKIAIYDKDEVEIAKQTREIMWRQALLEGLK